MKRFFSGFILTVIFAYSDNVMAQGPFRIANEHYEKETGEPCTSSSLSTNFRPQLIGYSLSFPVIKMIRFLH
jgi:hypothetical protein